MYSVHTPEKLLRVWERCLFLFLLVVGHSSASEDHCGKDGEGCTVNRVTSQSEASPLCYLAQEVGPRHVLEHAACGWKTATLEQVGFSFDVLTDAKITQTF